jgi:hypothetical protein
MYEYFGFTDSQARSNLDRPITVPQYPQEPLLKSNDAFPGVSFSKLTRFAFKCTTNSPGLSPSGVSGMIALPQPS